MCITIYKQQNKTIPLYVPCCWTQPASDWILWRWHCYCTCRGFFPDWHSKTLQHSDDLQWICLVWGNINNDLEIIKTYSILYLSNMQILQHFLSGTWRFTDPGTLDTPRLLFLHTLRLGRVVCGRSLPFKWLVFFFLRGCLRTCYTFLPTCWPTFRFSYFFL